MDVIDEHAGQWRRVLGLGELVQRQIDHGGQRGLVVAVAGQHRHQRGREGARHGGVELRGDLQAVVGDQPLDHHRVAAGAGALDGGHQILQQGVEPAFAHPLLGEGEGHGVGHGEVQQQAGEMGRQVVGAAAGGLSDRLDVADCDVVAQQRLDQAKRHRGQPGFAGDRGQEEDLRGAFHVRGPPPFAGGQAGHLGGVAGDHPFLVGGHHGGDRRGAGHGDHSPHAADHALVGGAVQGHAEGAQAGQRHRPHPRRVLADTAGEHHRVEPAQAHRQAADGARQPVREHVQRQLGPDMALHRGRFQLATVVGQLRQAEQAALLVQHRIHRRDVEVLGAHHVQHRAGVDLDRYVMSYLVRPTYCSGAGRWRITENSDPGGRNPHRSRSEAPSRAGKGRKWKHLFG